MLSGIQKRNKWIGQREIHGNKGNRISTLHNRLREGTENSVVLTHNEKRLNAQIWGGNPV